jgi:hypothetical protein
MDVELRRARDSAVFRLTDEKVSRDLHVELEMGRRRIEMVVRERNRKIGWVGKSELSPKQKSKGLVK